MRRIYILLIIVCFVLFIFTTNSFAIAPYNPELIKEYKAKGKLNELVERLNKLKTFLDEEAKGHEQRPMRSKGENKVLVIIINFCDTVLNSVSTPEFYETLFENGPNNNGLSWRKYYQDMSNNLLNLTFDVVGPYTSPDITRASCGTINDVKFLIVEAIELAENDGVDFSNYDNDDDGYVDGVIVIHTGRGYENSGDDNDIHSHMGFLNQSVFYDGVYIQKYTIQPEYKYVPGDSTIGVFVHEFGHILGLLDLYDYNYVTDGVGDWSTMACGNFLGNGTQPGPLLAWEKEQLGWITFSDITTPLSKNIPSMKSDNNFIIILSFGILSVIGILTTLLIGFKKGIKHRMTILLFVFLFVIPVSIFTYGCFETGFKLTIVVDPPNSGTIIKNPDNDYFQVSSEVLLAAFSNQDYTFSHWEGDITSISNPETITIDSDKSIKAVFKELKEGEYAIKDIELSGMAYKIALNSKQYYLLENKVKREGTWTEFLHGNGLLITHIDTRVTNNNGNSIHMINVKEADGNDELWTIWGHMGEEGDVYVFPKTLTPLTSPNTNLNGFSQNNGASSGISITDISEAGITMTFKYTRE